MSNSLLTLIPSLVLLLLAVITPVHAQSPPVIYSISGCPVVDGNTTSSCYAGSNTVLTIAGANLPLIFSLVNISGVPCRYPTGSSSRIYCQMMSGDLPLPLDTFLPVTITDATTLLTSDPAPLVSFSSYPPVVLSSISGCVDVGSTTTNCTSFSSLTVTGSGFTPGMGSRLDNSWQLSFTALTLVTLPVNTWRYLIPTSFSFNFSAMVGTTARLLNTGLVSFFVTHDTRVSTPLTFGFIPAPGSPESPARPSSPMNITSITSSQCTRPATGGVANNCNKPLTLTLRGTDFPINPFVTVADERCTPAGVTSTIQIICRIPDSFSQMPRGVFLPVVVYDLYNNVQTPPYYGVRLAPLTPPYIQSISGCVGSGQMTSSCYFESSFITLTGSGFNDDLLSWQVGVGSTVLSNDNGDWEFLGSQLVIPLIGLSNPDRLPNANGTYMLYVIHGVQLSNAVFLTYSQSALNVSRIVSNDAEYACTSVSLRQLTDCVAGVSVLTIYGTAFSASTTVFIANTPVDCRLFQDALGQNDLYCTVPVVEGAQGGVPYDLVVKDGGLDGVQVVVPGAISYTYRPTISSITSRFCPRDPIRIKADAYSMLCAAGDVITVIGGGFVQSDALQVVLSIAYVTTSGYTTVERLCAPITVLSSSTLTCVLPALNATEMAVFGDQYATVEVHNNGSSVSNFIYVQLYRSPTHPAVYSVTGCAGPDDTGRGVVGCKTGSLVTINGDNFGTSDVQVDVYAFDVQLSYICQLASISQGTQVTCVLPYIAHLESELTLPIRVTAQGIQSNWLLGIGISAGLTPSGQGASIASGTSYLAPFIVFVVLFVAVSIAWAVTLVVCLRRSSRDGKPMMGGGADRDASQLSRSGANNFVEMS